jgi:hypothetical protein
MGSGPLSTGPFNPIPADNIPPPPDGSGIVAAHASVASTNLPPPPDGSGVAPGGDGTETVGGFADELPDQPATKMAPEDVAHVQDMVASGQSAEAVLAFLHSKGFSDDPAHPVSAAVEYAKTHPGYRPGHIDSLPKAPDAGVARAAAGGIADTLTMGGAPKIAAGLSAVGKTLSGEGSLADNYNRALDSFNAQKGSDEQNHPWARIFGQVAAGFALPMGLEGVATRAETAALSAGKSLEDAHAIGLAAVRQRLVAGGAGYGAAHGAGSADSLPDAVTGGLTEGAIGAAGSALLAPLARSGKALTAGSAAQGATQDLAEAASRQGIDILPADVAGATVRRLTGAAAQAPLSASPIINAAKRVLQQGQAAVMRQAPGATEASTAGEAARTGAEGYIRRTSSIGGALYDRAARRAGDAMIDPVKARQVLDDQIARLQAVPGGGQGLEEAQAMRSALDGKFSVQGIRDMRTEHFVDPALRGSPTDTRMKQVISAAADDVENGLRAQGKDDAAGAFRTADNFWRNRLDTIDNVIRPIIGQPGAKGGQAISKAIDTAAKGDLVKAQRFLGTLAPAERQVVSSSLIERLGRATRGQQNAEGDAFSLSTFLSNWSDLSPRARATLFTPEQRAALQDVATVADGVREASRYANHSNTAGGIWGNLGALVGLGSVAPHVAAGGLAAQVVGGKLLASPRFARWLARAPKTSLSAPAYVDRLTRIARAEPAIANEVLQLQQRLTDAFAGSPTRMAADERRNEVGGTEGSAGQQQAPAQGAQP